MNPRSEFWRAQEREMITNFFEKIVPETLKSTKTPLKPSGEADQGAALPTEEDCISFAKRILMTGDVQLVDNQGAFSYTLICPSQSKIVQFRLKRFDDEILAFAQQIYGDLVPSVTFYDGFPLPVYVSSVVPGQLHLFQKFPATEFPLKRQLTTVVELAQFVAKSAHWPRPKSAYSATSHTLTARSTLEKLSQNADLKKVEPRFIVKALALIEKVPLLDKLPPVLFHPDFAEVNIFVNDKGNVTGVIDFEDATIEAFGMCLFGVYEGFFGAMNNQKWSYFDQPAGDGSNMSVRGVLETAFWKTLWDSVPPAMKKEELEEAVMVALNVGIVNRYFVRGLLERVDLENQEHRGSLEFARGLLLDR
ncbi:hypothetical protein PRK78_004734 [Emydomyces testavorans]|uniref:Aminoglycoside phosphotransferase domain-containing protein n=1 Tax=Emydomyces testavorans TaxID=2070801 RepID=A0AAF0DIH8_9EURO|nr:hypothetical protein PRK78_004734 [Emydomyces testavorans]